MTSAPTTWNVVGDGEPLPDAAIAALAALLVDDEEEPPEEE